MNIIILLFCLIIQKSVLAQNETNSLSAKLDYQQAFKRNEQNVSRLKEKQRIYAEAKKQYQLAQDNLKTAQQELIESEANFKDAQIEAKKSAEDLKQFGAKLDAQYLRNDNQ